MTRATIKYYGNTYSAEVVTLREKTADVVFRTGRTRPGKQGSEKRKTVKVVTTAAAFRAASFGCILVQSEHDKRVERARLNSRLLKGLGHLIKKDEVQDALDYANGDLTLSGVFHR